ncbi:MAG: leucyl/phenylalanyl-tRNA--protein transferase [Chthonomonadales bacterium]|nr:leucyl/phenylalanyl-tRNA--protein transferase [Chthonomonadales bacterium]
MSRRVLLSFTPEGLVSAYREAVFPMADSVTGRLYWMRPDPRAVIPLDGFHMSRSLARAIRRGRFEVRVDTDFEGVMRGCADRAEGTWITEEFVAVYGELHRRGAAHSVEAWSEGRLVGGTYGLALGAAFMAESMFHRETDASKVALAALVARLRERGFALLDVQYLTPHLSSLGAVEIPGALYYALLRGALRLEPRFTHEAG